MSKRPQPTELKIARGNPGRRPLNEREPQPDKGVPDALEALTPAARIHFDRLAEQLTAVNVLTVNDGVALSGLAQSIADFEEATRALAVDGKVVRTERGLVKSPWTTIQKQAFDQMQKGFIEFGLTPSSRSSIKTVGTPSTKGEKAARQHRFFGTKSA